MSASHIPDWPRNAPASAPAGGSPAHDLRNMLGVLLGVSESLCEMLEPGSEAAELARVGLLAAERAAGCAGRLEPAATEGPTRTEEAADSAPQVAARPSVLVVDDDPDLLRVLTRAFERAGYDAAGATDGCEAVERLRTFQPDLLVTDIVMPHKEGIATILESRRRAPDMAVIAMSGGGHYGRAGNFLQWAAGLGADAAVSKPFTMSELLAVADDVLAARRSAAAAAAF